MKSPAKNKDTEEVKGMSIKWMAVLAGLFFLTVDAYAGEPVAIKTPKDQVNYSIGVSTIRHFKQYGNAGDIDLSMVLQGMQDELSGKQLLITERELGSVLLAVQTEIIQRKRTARILSSMPGSTATSGTVTAKP